MSACGICVFTNRDPECTDPMPLYNELVQDPDFGSCVASENDEDATEEDEEAEEDGEESAGEGPSTRVRQSTVRTHPLTYSGSGIGSVLAK